MMNDDIVIQTLRTIAQQTFQTSGILIKFLGLRLLDLVGGIFNVLAVCTIVRIPGLISMCQISRNRLRLDLWKFAGIIQVAIFIVDIPFLIISPLLFIFFWRIILLAKEHGPLKFDDFGYEGWKLRKLIWKHFCLLCSDIFTVPFVVFVSVSWRGPKFIAKMRNAQNEVEWKLIIFGEFAMLLTECITFPILLFLMVSWRGKTVRNELIRKIRYVSRQGYLNRSYEELLGLSELQILYTLTEIPKRDAFAAEFFVTISQSFALLCDLVTLPVLTTLLLSWRHKVVILIIKPWYLDHISVSQSSTNSSYSEGTIRFQVWWQFIHLCIDILHIPFLIPICCTWRLFFFVRCMRRLTIESILSPHQIANFKPFNMSHTWVCAIRSKILKHGLLVVADCIVMSMFYSLVVFSVIFPWRLLNTIKGITKSYKAVGRFSMRSVSSCIVTQFCYLLTDIPLTILGLITLLTIWRAPFLVSEILQHLSKIEEITEQTTWDTMTLKEKMIKNEIVRQFCLLIADILTAPFILLIFGTLWRIKPFIDSVKESYILPVAVIPSGEAPIETHTGEMPNCSTYKLSQYDGSKIRYSALVNCLIMIIVDIPCLTLLIINTVCLLRLPALITSFLSCQSFYNEYPVIVLTETVNLLVDFAFICLGGLLLCVRPLAVIQNLSEDEKHRKVRELNESMVTITHLLKKRITCESELQEMVNCITKSFNSCDENMAKYFLSKIVVRYHVDLDHVRMKLIDRSVDDRFIYLISKYLFLQDKHSYYMYRRYLVERIFLKHPSTSMRNRNLELFNMEYSIYKKKINDVCDDIIGFPSEKVPLWREKIGFLNRTRKANQRIIIKTLTTGYIPTLLLILLNCTLVYRALPLLYRIYKEPLLIRKKAVKNLEQYWLDIKCVVQIMIVILSVYRCPDLISDLIVDIFCKRSVTALRFTVASYPPNLLKDIKHVFLLVLKWRTIAYFIASILFFCFIPLSAIIHIAKQVIAPRYKVIGSIILYALIAAAPIGIIYNDNVTFINEQLFEYYGFLLVILVVFTVVVSKRSLVLPEVDYVRINWGFFHLVIHEFVQTGQILALLYSLDLQIDQDGTLKHYLQMLLLDSGNPITNVRNMNYIFYIWFFVSSAPPILEGVLQYVPHGRFSKKNFSWQLLLSFFGSTMFIAIPYLGLSYLSAENASVWTMDSGGRYTAIWCVLFVVWYLLTSVLFFNQYYNVTNTMTDLKYSPAYSTAINLIKLSIVIAFSFLNAPPIFLILIFIGCVVAMFLLSVFYSKMVPQKPCNSNLLIFWRLASFAVIIIIAVLCGITEMVPYFAFALQYVTPVIIVLSFIVMVSVSQSVRKYSENELARAQFIESVSSIEKILQTQNNFTVTWKETRSSWRNLLKVVRVANDFDKEAEQVVDAIFTEMVDSLSSEAPPNYNTANSSLMDSLPTYDELSALQPTPSTQTEDFIPDLDYLTTPLGVWQPYSALLTMQKFAYLDSLDSSNIDSTIDDKKCTGSQILLLLEKYTKYTVLSTSCVRNLSVWRALVSKANWIGLNKYAGMLKSAITGDFDKPKVSASIVSMDDMLSLNEDKSAFPEYIDIESLSDMKLKVHTRERTKLLSILPYPWPLLFEKLLSQNYPIISKIVEDRENNLIILHLFKETKISITSVPGDGYKVAVGGEMMLPKTLHFFEISDKVVKFKEPYPTAGKSLFSVDLKMLRYFETGEEKKIGISDDETKTGVLDTVLETLVDLAWEVDS